MTRETDITNTAISKATQMMQESQSRQEILACLIQAAEDLAGPGSASSILILDKEGLLRNGYSPQLPKDYLAAIDGLKPHPFVGTCASAAATGDIVVTLDFKSDSKWAELKHLPLSLGYLGAWSHPIKTDDGKVIGTFGTYFRENRRPTADEIDGVQKLAKVAARVLA